MHSKAALSALRTLCRSTAPRTPRLFRTLPTTHARFPRVQPLSTSYRRFNSVTTKPVSQPSSSIPSESESNASSKPLTNRVSSRNTGPRPAKPEYQITFTCKPCGTRSSHHVSKQGYHYGSTLITCPECRNRHIISDHLNIFGDKSMTIEDLMRERGQLVKKGTLSEDGDVEFWEDGTTTKHVKNDAVKEERTP